MNRLFWICLAGALGTGARHLVGTWAAQRFVGVFPWGTFLVNSGGSFAMCFLMHLALATSFEPTLRLALTTGFLGGLTTYSAFNYETLLLIEQGLWKTALLNASCTVFGCAAAGLLGFALARQLW